MNEIMEKVEKIVKQVQKDPKMLAKFKTEPVKVVEQLLGVDLPDALVKNVIAGVTDALKNDGKKDGKEDDGKLDMDDLKGAANLLKKLF